MATNKNSKEIQRVLRNAKAREMFRKQQAVKKSKK